LVAAAITGGRIVIDDLALSSVQPDVLVAHHLADMGCHVDQGEAGMVLDATDVELAPVEADMSEAPDGALALAVACLFAKGESRLDGLHSLRLKESDRLHALSTELTRLGGKVEVVDDSLFIGSGTLTRAAVDSHGDHRIAMSCALVGLVVDGVSVEDPGVVNKTWPGYWDMLDGISG
jgi:3-phosphoshikimate 1-carboxyvinyltransferase